MARELFCKKKLSQRRTLFLLVQTIYLPNFVATNKRSAGSMPDGA
jgi:hypothetical protein